MIRFSHVLWHVNPLGLFNTKFSLSLSLSIYIYIYIYIYINKSEQFRRKINFKRARDHLFTQRGFQILLSNIDISIKYQSFVCNQLKGFEFYYGKLIILFNTNYLFQVLLTLAILFSINHFFAHRYMVSSIADCNNSISQQLFICS